MMFNTWWQRRKQSTDAARADRRQTYRPAQYRTRLHLEALEDRTLPSVNTAIVTSAFQTVLQDAQTSLTSVLGTVASLPLVGTQLSSFVGSSSLASQLVNVLASSPSLSNAAPGTFEFPIQAHIQKSLNFDLGLGANLLTLQKGTDTGDVLTVNVNLDFYYLVDFTYNTDNTVTIKDPTQESPPKTLNDFNATLPKNTLAVTLGVTLPGFNAAASLNGFLFARVKDHAATDQSAKPTSFNASFGVTPTNPSTGSFTGMALSGDAHVDLDLDLYLADPSLPNLPINPHLQTEFVLEWKFNVASASALDAKTAGFSVDFKNLRLDVGNLIPGFLQQVINDVQRVTEPLQPIVDMVNQNIPGLDQLGIHKSLRDILAATNTASGALSALDDIGFINSLHFPAAGADYISFGDFGLSGFGQTPQIGPLGGNLAKTAADFLGQAVGDIPALAGMKVNTDPQAPYGFSFPILTDPLNCASQLLLGKDPALFTYRLKPIDLPGKLVLGANLLVASLTLTASIDLKINASVGYDTSGIRMLLKDGNAADLLHGFYIDGANTGVTVDGSIIGSAGVLGLNISGGVTAHGSLQLDPTLEDGQHRIHLDQKLLDELTGDPGALFVGAGNISISMDLSYGFDTPFGSVTLFSLNVAHLTIYDFMLGRTPPSPPAPPSNTILLDMTDADEIIKVHNFSNIRPDNGFLDEWDGIEVDYNPQPNGHALTKNYYYVSHTTNNNSSQTNITTSLATFNLIAVDKIANGNNTIKITGDTYLYDGAQPNDITFVRDDQSGVMPLNAVLIGGSGNDNFTYHGSGTAILVGGGGDNYLEGGQYEFGGNVPSGFLTTPPFPIPAGVPAFPSAQVSRNDTLIGTAGNDLMVGSAGTNHFDGLGGNDTMYGGAGNDQFRVNAALTGAPQIFGGGGNDSLVLNDIPAVQYLTPSPADSIDIRLQADPAVRDANVAGKQALDVNVIGGSGILAEGITTLAISTYGGPISIQDLNSTSVKSVSIDSHSNAVTPVSVTVHGTSGADTFALASRYEVGGSYASEVDEGSGALPIVVEGLTSVDHLIMDGGTGNDNLVLKDAVNSGLAIPSVATTVNFSSSSSGTITESNLPVSYLNFSRIADNGTGPYHTLTLEGSNFVGYPLYVYLPFNNETVSYSLGAGYTIQLDGATITTNVSLVNDLTNVTNVVFPGSAVRVLNLSDGPVVDGVQTTNVYDNYVITIPLPFGLPPLHVGPIPSAQLNFANKTTVKVTEAWNSSLDTRLAAAGLSTLRIEPGDNRVAVQSTAPGVVTTLAKTVAGAGTEYDIGSSRPGVGVQDLHGPINITDSIPNPFNLKTTETLDGTILKVDDSQDTLGHYVVIGLTIHGLAPADISYADTAGLASVTVLGGSGSNTFSVSTARAIATDTSAPLATLYIDCGSGIDTVLVNAYVSRTAFDLFLNGSSSHDYVELFSFKKSAYERGGGNGGQPINGKYYSLLSVGRITVTFPGNWRVFSQEIGVVDGFQDLSPPSYAHALIIGGPSTLRIEGTSANDTVLLRYDPADPTLLQATVNGVVEYDGSFTNLRNMTIDTGTGQDTVSIEDLPAAVSLLILDLGSAVVNLGKAGSVQSLRGSVNMVNEMGSTTVNIDNSADTAARNVVVNNQTIVGLAPGTIAFEQLGLAGLNIRAGTGAGSVMVVSTPSNGTTADVTTLVSVGGADAISVGSKGSLLGIQGTLVLETLAAGATITVDDSNDTVKQAVLLDSPNGPASYEVAGLTPNPIHFSVASLNSLTVDGGNAANTYTVSGTPAGVPVVLNTGAGADTTSVGNSANSLSDLGGPLTVHGVPGRGTLAVNDQGAVGIATYVVSASGIIRAGAAPITYTAMNAIVLDTAAGGNMTTVQSTSATTVLTIVAGNGTDAINVGDSKNLLDAVKGPLTVNGAAGTAALIISDQGAAARAYTVTTGAVTRTGAATISFGSVASLVLNTGSGSTTDVQTTGINTPVTVNTGSGTNIVNAGTPANRLGNIVTLTVNGGTGGTTTLNLDDQANADRPYFLIAPGFLQTRPTYLITDDSVVRSDAQAITQFGVVFHITAVSTISYQNLAALTVNGGASTNIFNVQSTAASTATTINAGVAADTVNVGSAGNTIDGLLGPLTINGKTVKGTNNTALNVNDQGTTADKTYSLSATSLTRTAYPPPDAGRESITYSKIGTLVVNGGTGNNLFGVTGTSTGTTVSLFGGTANSDQFMVGNNNSLDSILGTLTLHGQTAYSFVVLSDLLNVVAHTYTLSSTKLQRTRMADISYDALDQFVLYGGKGKDVFNVASTLAATPVVIVANNSTATFNIGATVHNVTTSVVGQ